MSGILTGSVFSASVIARPSFSSGGFTATDSADGGHAANFFNQSTQSVTLTTGQLLLVAIHSEFTFGDFDDLYSWYVTWNSLPLELLCKTDGYNGGASNGLFHIWYLIAPSSTTANLFVATYDLAARTITVDANELAVGYTISDNVAQINSPFTSLNKDISHTNRTGESVTVTSNSNDLIYHLIASGLATPGALGSGETSRVVANDTTDDASILISTKNGASTNTTVSTTGWTSSKLQGVALAIAPVGTAETNNPFSDNFTRANENPLSKSGAWATPTNASVSPLAVVSNQAKGSSATENLSRVSTPTQAADQRARHSYLGATYSGPCARMQASGACYCASTNTSNEVQILKITDVGGLTLGYSTLDTTGSLGWNLTTNDLVELEAIGTGTVTLNVYINQVLKKSTTDGSAPFNSGQTGERVFGADACASAYKATTGTVRY